MRNINNHKNIIIRCKTFYIIIFSIFIIFINNISFAYDDKITHPNITDRASQPENSQLDYYLKNYLGFYKGIATPFTSGSRMETIKDWLKQGSIDEDSPACRASNHFHDPLKTWNQSKMSDDLIGAALGIRLECDREGWTYSNRQSNVTWATGYLSPSPGGQKQTFSSNPVYAPINWDTEKIS